MKTNQNSTEVLLQDEPGERKLLKSKSQLEIICCKQHSSSNIQGQQGHSSDRSRNQYKVNTSRHHFEIANKICIGTWHWWSRDSYIPARKTVRQQQQQLYKEQFCSRRLRTHETPYFTIISWATERSLVEQQWRRKRGALCTAGVIPGTR